MVNNQPIIVCERASFKGRKSTENLVRKQREVLDSSMRNPPKIRRYKLILQLQSAHPRPGFLLYQGKEGCLVGSVNTQTIEEAFQEGKHLLYKTCKHGNCITNRDSTLIII